ELQPDFYSNFPWLVHGPLTVYQWPPEVKERVTAVIQQQPELAIFQGHTQYFPGGGQIVRHEDLAEWLLERTRRVGAETAVTELERYLATENIPYNSQTASDPRTTPKSVR